MRLIMLFFVIYTGGEIFICSRSIHLMININISVPIFYYLMVLAFRHVYI